MAKIVKCAKWGMRLQFLESWGGEMSRTPFHTILGDNVGNLWAE